MTTRKDGSDALLFRQGYDLKNRLVEADADGDADADLRLACDHQEGRVARHTLDGTAAVTASEHYLLDRINPTGYEQVLEQAVRCAGGWRRRDNGPGCAGCRAMVRGGGASMRESMQKACDGARSCAIVRDSRAAAMPQTAPEARRAIRAK